VQSTDHYQALGTILGGLEKIATSGLTLASNRTTVISDLGTILDEMRIVIEESMREVGVTLNWQIAADLPLVQADQHNLMQVFLNLARNAERAMEDSVQKELRVEACTERDLVAVRFRDTGYGVASPDDLFRPFQPGAHATGLGLFISRAILRSNGGDLRHEPQLAGSCFIVELWPAEEEAHA
jgi:C4-dicarboxylate-specific signal transduction histidine kinase